MDTPQHSLIPLILVFGLMACRNADKAITDDTGDSVDLPIDQDGDGFVDSQDCNDLDASVHPSAEEICDGLDNDCDEEVDEGVTATGYDDQDGDGFGDPLTEEEVCSATEGVVLNGSDCDDTAADISPSAEEICDGLDNNCDDEIDEGLLSAWYTDADADGFGDDSLESWACDAPTGTVAVGGDCNDAAPSAWPGATEICDEIDNDCDGDIDEGVTEIWYKDQDGDSYGENSVIAEACTVPVGYADTAGDCDDEDATIFPGADEYCDGVDNDCDGDIDEDDALDVDTWYKDEDSDGYGNELISTEACDVPAGYVAPTTEFDCRDTDPTIYPGADEYCDIQDNDCDGDIDEDDAVDALEWFPDSDHDAYGEPGYSIMSCTHPSGYVGNDDDCDDEDPLVNPDESEICGGGDEDCNGLIDEDDPGVLDILTWYSDFDSDGYGDADRSMEACEAPSLYVSDDTDCDDGDNDSYPGASESCDFADNDCDGIIDDGVLGTHFDCPAVDCLEILEDNPFSSSATYWLEYGQAECDMDVDGGGWTQVKEFAPLRSLTHVEELYNEEELEWEEVWFEYNLGTFEAGCFYPIDMPGCNPIVVRFGSEDWAIPDGSGGEDCGMSFGSYQSATFYPSSSTYDFAISRAVSTDTIEVGTLEGVAECSTEDNTGIAHTKVWIR